MHPTVKQAQLLADVILDASHRDALVLDPFLGSGSTLIAAELVGRRCFGLELSPAYTDLIVRRWEQLTGRPATLGVGGASFSEVADHRAERSSGGGRDGD